MPLKKISECTIQKLFYYRVYLLLGFILLLSAYLRFSGINWGFFHPDEAFYTRPVMEMYTGNTNFGEIIQDWPCIYHYILLIALVWIQHFVNISITQDTIIILGRGLSAIFSLCTVFICYAIGKEIHSVKVGLISAILFGINNLAVLHAHFSTLDSVVTFFFILTIYTAVKLKKSDKKFVYLIITGVLAGLTVGIKYTGGIVFLPILIIILLDQSVPILKRAQQSLISLFIAGSIFLLACPFILISFDRFLLSLSRLNEFKLGFYGLFPKYAETGYQWYLAIGFPWGYGIVFSVLAVLAVFYGIFYSVKNRDFIIFSFPITIFGYFIIVCQYHMYMMRYILLITPLLCILSAIFIVEIFNFMVKIINRPLLLHSQHIFLFLIVVVILIQPFFFMMTYNNLLSKENVRVEAKRWIESSQDQNALINMGPSPAPSIWMLPTLVNQSRYVSQPLTSLNSSLDIVYMPLAKNVYLRYLYEKNLYVDEDFIPYPPPSDEILEYYSTLYGDTTNYTLVAVFNRTPNFLGYSIDESNVPYEVTHVTHPEIRIYMKN